MLTISPDGYIRLAPAQFSTTVFNHLISGLDEDNPPFSGESAACTAITGYTEWLSETEPKLSVGWDWMMGVEDGKVCFHRVGEPRSNCMLVDAEQRDLGHLASKAALACLVDAFGWQQEVERQIAARYGQSS
jgi:hypothetical protein